MLDRWMREYELQLVKARKERPHQFLWPDSELRDFLRKMRVCFENGHFNKETRTIRSTCAVLKIPFTYTAIAKFIKGK